MSTMKSRLLNTQSPTGRLSGTATNRDTGGSVFHAPDPDTGGSYMRTLLEAPEKLSNIVAERAANTVAVKVFGAEKRVNTGAGYFAPLDVKDLETEGVAERAEGTEYAMVRISPTDLERVNTKDIGGKFKVSDEALEAGTVDIIGDGVALISNSLIDTLDDMVFAALDKSVANTVEFEIGHNWGEVQLTGATPTPARETPNADLVRAQARLSTAGLRGVGSLLVLNPMDEANLKIAYGDGYAALLEGLGLETTVSPKAPAGEAYLVDPRGLGGVVSKKGLVTETWRDQAIRSTWVQTYLEPAVYITRPHNVVKIVGIAGNTEGEV